MNVPQEELRSKILSLYPEIEQFGLDMDLAYDEGKEAWIATFSKGENKLSTHLEAQDVEACLQGKECYHLGTQLGRFIRHYCEGGSACRL